MTTGRREAVSPKDDALLSQLYQQVTEEQAARFAAGYDTAAGLARYRAWLGQHTAAEQAGGTGEIATADPAQSPPAPPGGPARPRGRGPSPSRRRASWLAPVLAAAAVVALAATLVFVATCQPGPRSRRRRPRHPRPRRLPSLPTPASPGTT